MSSLCEVTSPSTQRREARPDAEDRPRTIIARCHALLDEAQALGLDLDDIIDALRHAAPTPRSLQLTDARP